MILGEYSDDLLPTIRLFGINLGIAFQVYDDILGTFGDESVQGKSTTSDICEGKNTLLISYSLQKATKSQKKQLNKFYGNPNVTPENCDEIKAIFMDTGAYNYSIALAKKHLRLAQRQIPRLTKNQDYQMLLYEFSKTVLYRNS